MIGHSRAGERRANRRAVAGQAERDLANVTDGRTRNPRAGRCGSGFRISERQRVTAARSVKRLDGDGATLTADRLALSSACQSGRTTRGRRSRPRRPAPWLSAADAAPEISEMVEATRGKQTQMHVRGAVNRAVRMTFPHDHAHTWRPRTASTLARTCPERRNSSNVAALVLLHDSGAGTVTDHPGALHGLTTARARRCRQASRRRRTASRDRASGQIRRLISTSAVTAACLRWRGRRASARWR